MSEAMAFDTRRYVKRLTESGFTEEQAEALADGQVALLNGNFVTKAEIADVRTGIAAVKADIFKWMIGLAFFAQAGVVVALIKLLE